MILKTENKTVELVPTTRKIVTMTKENKAKNLNEYFFSVVNDKNIEGLANIIYSFAENEDRKGKPFNNVYDVYDFIDTIRSEQNKSYNDLFNELGEAINEMGFFNEKMTKDQLKSAMDNPMAGLDMKKMISQSTEKAITDVVSEEFRGYKA
ncbi:MAG TPA: hypothetical protein IAB27_05195 [Candidatus Coprosoma intestinipullorum]|uniref:Uncharacterized protein n=1 Tax=Candidatus Coprosoma intestinipullorum TaxID=2840752 RepID=A0A9D0ZRI4_9FIRM|nr:hypothetical protein [Candidatus Coprosoma intestinipullorum]